MSYFLFIAVTALTVASSCASSLDGYKLVTQNKGFAHFTFECPAQYVRPLWRLPRVEMKQNFTRLFTYHRDKKIPIDSIIEVIAWRVMDSASYDNAEDLMKQRLSMFGRELDFEIKEYLSVQVTGISAQGFMFTYSALGVGSDSVPGVRRAVFFDHNGVIWEISMVSDSTRTEAAKADFDHLLETFIILD
jgi:hypothetical protein